VALELVGQIVVYKIDRLTWSLADFAKAAICLPLRCPNSGISPIRVRAVTGPTPGTDVSRRYISHHAGDLRICSLMPSSTSDKRHGLQYICPNRYSELNASFFSA
jgi:hypothetical protein